MQTGAIPATRDGGKEQHSTPTQLLQHGPQRLIVHTDHLIQIRQLALRAVPDSEDPHDTTRIENFVVHNVR